MDVVRAHRYYNYRDITQKGWKEKLGTECSHHIDNSFLHKVDKTKIVDVLHKLGICWVVFVFVFFYTEL